MKNIFDKARNVIVIAFVCCCIFFGTKYYYSKQVKTVEVVKEVEKVIEKETQISGEPSGRAWQISGNYAPPNTDIPM